MSFEKYEMFILKNFKKAGRPVIKNVVMAKQGAITWTNSPFYKKIYILK